MGLQDRENKRSSSVVSNLVGRDGKDKSKSQNNETQEFTSVHYKITSKSHKDIKKRAIEEGKKDYEVVQDALDAYFSNYEV